MKDASRLPYKLISPFVVIELFLVVIPLGYGFYYSLFDVRYFTLQRFAGLGNYFKLLTSPDIHKAFGVTVEFAGFSLLLTFVVGFGFALLLNRDIRSNVGMRAVVLIPHTIAMLVGSMLFKWIVSQDSGLLSYVLSLLRLGNPSVLTTPSLAMTALVSNAVWRNMAFAMVLLMAGLKSIPDQLYEAARIDGAGRIAQFALITVPLVKPVIVVVLIRMLIHFVNVLTFALVLTGGAPNGETRPLSLSLYRLGFESYQFGQANALAFLMLGINLVLILALVTVMKEKNQYAMTRTKR